MKKPPRKQLIEAGKFAQELLLNKGVIGKNLISEIVNDSKNPTLPGIPPYLPHRWTLKVSQRMMLDLLSEWLEKNKKDRNRVENFTKFIEFVIGRMNEEISKANEKIVIQPKLIKTLQKIPVLKDIFSPLREKRVVKEMQKFFYDSFAVAVTVKQHSGVSQYAEWFLDWTQRMEMLWQRNRNTQG